MEIAKIAIESIAAIAALVGLIKLMVDAFKKKDWPTLLRLALSIIEEAEDIFVDGEDKKYYAVDEIVRASRTVGCTLTAAEASQLVDEIVTTTNRVNVK